MSMVSLPGLKVLIETLSKEKNLPQQIVQGVLQEALLTGYERYRRDKSLDAPNLPEDYFNNFQVQLDLKGEGFRILANKTVVETVTEPDHEVSLKKVLNTAKPVSLGARVIVDVTPQQGEFGRRVASQTKQVLTQKLQEQQCKFVQELFGDLKRSVISARVLRSERRGIIFGVSNGKDAMEFEAELPNYERLPQDEYIPDAKFQVYLKKIADTPRPGSLLRVSRASSHLVSGLLTNTVPAIQQGIIQIMGTVRDAIPNVVGVCPRSKIAVTTQEEGLDPVAICIGEGGVYLQAVINELRGEKIEIIPWSEDVSIYITNALIPAVVDKVVIVDAEQHIAQVFVPDAQLALAMGEDNQNLRLASRLTGWTLEIKTKGNED